ncbi:MAG: ABC transporter permease [Actinobacteria bacterium]|nr:ABC transporter permease [Actinomycetota bacterium]
MGKLIVSSLKLLYRDKQALFWALAFPVIFAVIFGLFDFTDVPDVDIAVVVEEGSPVSEGLLDGLGEIDAFSVTSLRSLDVARDELVKGYWDVVLGVPAAAPGQPLLLFVLYNETNFETNQFAISAIERLAGVMNLQIAGVDPPPVAVESRGIAGKSVEYYDFLLPGLVAMGVMNFSIIGMSVAISRFREQRILKRILATPLRPVKFLTAQVVARLALALVQAALILAVGVYVFGANLYGNVLWLFALATVANLIFLNLGFAVAGRAANPDAAQGIANAVALPMMFLSGVFFPTETLPEVMQVVVRYLPLTPLIEAMRTVAIDGESILRTGPQLALLGAWVAVSFAIAARNFRFARA